MPAERTLDPFYYLQNFSSALSWIRLRHGDVLHRDELSFIEDFECVPRASQALLVRLIMRKGPHFRSSKVKYAEIGCVRAASAPLLRNGWLDDAPALTLADLCRLLRRDELNNLFPEARRHVRKSELLEALCTEHTEARTLQAWCGRTEECAYQVNVAPLCTRLRLLFFGSFHQDWSEFVLTDLKIFNYEPIELSLASRPFRDRGDLDRFVSLFECRERLHAKAPWEDVLSSLPLEPLDNGWLEARRAKLLYQLAYRAEREGLTEQALDFYGRSAFPGARLRKIRVLERAGRLEEAHAHVDHAMRAPESDAELQRLKRIVARLRPKLGLQRLDRAVDLQPPRLDLTLEPTPSLRVEERVRQHFQNSACEVFYVENALINSLFGLLCWDAIFAPVRGAFFHRFHSGPMDLLSPDFRTRREEQFKRCFDWLTTGEYIDCIKHRFSSKQGVQSPFVAWGLLNESLLDLSLACIPAGHLQLYFERLLANLQENCTGLPDLIQFWPGERRYRMLEVKGPGDRLQDNQKRWMTWCLQQSLPIGVVHVRWADRPSLVSADREDGPAAVCSKER